MLLSCVSVKVIDAYTTIEDKSIMPKADLTPSISS